MRDRLRVLLVNGNFGDGTIGGTQTATLNLAGGLARSGHTVAVLCQGSASSASVSGGIRVYRLRPFRFPERRAKTAALYANQCLAIHNPWVTRLVKEIVADFAPDICHLQMLRRLTPAVITAVRRCAQVTAVQTVHEMYSLWNFNAFQFEDSPEKIYSKKPLIVDLFKLRHRVLSRALDHVCAPSIEALRPYWADGYFGGVPYSVLPLGVPFEWGAPWDAAAERIRRLGASPQTRFLFMGRLDFYKGVELLLEAMAASPSAAFELGVAGEGPMEGPVRAYALRDPRVIFHGPVHGERRRRLFRHADVLLFPSTWGETYGLSVAEARTCALPSIVSNVGALPRIVDHGRTGLVIEPSAPQLAEAMGRMADPNVRREMIVRCAASADDLNLELFIQRQVEVYGLAREARKARVAAARR